MWSGANNRFLTALRADLVLWSTAVHKNLITGVQTVLDIEGGSTTDDATSNIRRSLSLTLPGAGATWDALNTQGGEITVTQTLGYVDQSTVTVPMGVYVVDQEQLGYAPGGQITMTCPDRMLKIQRNGFGLSRSSVPGNMAWQEIKRLVEGAWPSTSFPFPGWSLLDTSATTKVGILTWSDGSRENALFGDSGLVDANGLELFFDRTGLAVLRPKPVLTPGTVPVWLVDASDTGVMIDATRTRDRTNLRNAIIASSSASDVVFADIEEKITDPTDPVSVTGPLGYVPENWSSSLFRNSAQARAAALTRLRQRAGAAQSVSLTGLSNPALDSVDVIGALYPQIDSNTPPAYELHILDSIVTPLLPGDTQDMQTRSTRPLTDGS